MARSECVMKKPLARIISSLGERIWRAARVDWVYRKPMARSISIYAVRVDWVYRKPMARNISLFMQREGIVLCKKPMARSISLYAARVDWVMQEAHGEKYPSLVVVCEAICINASDDGA